MADQHPIQPAISRQRIRVPQQNKTALHLPPLRQATARFDSNRNRIQDQAAIEFAISFLPETPKLGAFQRQSRNELIECAFAYSSQYLPSGDGLPTADQAIIMSGHQPELFHAGVWYKNFVLSELAKRTGAVAINLVVDSDLSNRNSIRFPDLKSSPIRSHSIAIDKPAAAVPFEQRSIKDLPFLFALPGRVNQAMGNDCEGRIANRLWPEVADAYRKLGNSSGEPTFGATIAAGRHRFEHTVGLKTLEVPVSQLCQTTAFATFAAAIFDRAKEFREVYNQSLVEYRNAQSNPQQFAPRAKTRSSGRLDGGAVLDLFEPNTRTRTPVHSESQRSNRGI